MIFYTMYILDKHIGMVNVKKTGDVMFKLWRLTLMSHSGFIILD